MRAIDADKLCTDLMERWDIADKQKEELVKQVMADIVTPIVVCQPTIEPERKKGKWIYKNDLKQFFCSECGFPSLTYDDVYIYSMDLPNYCEDCGTDMREEQEGEG